MKLQKLMNIGSNKIEDELNVVKIMNDLRNLKILLKNMCLTKDVKDKIRHTGKNIIDLDSESSDSSQSLQGPTHKEVSVQSVHVEEEKAAGNNAGNGNSLQETTLNERLQF